MNEINNFYSAPVGERCIVISLSVCLCVCLSASISLEPLDQSSGKFFVQILVAVTRFSSGGVRCDTLCTSGCIDDITFRRNGPYGDAWKAEPLTYYFPRMTYTVSSGTLNPTLLLYH